MAKLCSAFLRVMGNGIVFSLPDGQQISLSKIDGRYAPPSKMARLCSYVVGKLCSPFSGGQGLLNSVPLWRKDVPVVFPILREIRNHLRHG